LDKIEVKCYSGYTYAQRPISFTWHGRDYEVDDIEKEWLVPGGRWFLVKTEGSKYFKLCYNEAQDEWSITEAVKEQENAKRNT
jgi:hypothetical protein